MASTSAGPDSSDVDEKLTISQSKLERLVNNQIQSLDALSSNLTVVLGLVITSVGFILTLGRGALARNIYLGLPAVALLAASALILMWSITFLDYFDAPDPRQLLRSVADPSVDRIRLKQGVVADLALAYYRNRAFAAQAFQLFLGSTAMLVGGLVLLTLDVLI